MATMTSQQQQECWADYMRTELEAYVGALTKAELRAAIGATDQWISDNSASYNSAIPQPARGVLTASQKARLIAAVVLKRWKVGA